MYAGHVMSSPISPFFRNVHGRIAHMSNIFRGYVKTRWNKYPRFFPKKCLQSSQQHAISYKVTYDLWVRCKECVVSFEFWICTKQNPIPMP